MARDAEFRRRHWREAVLSGTAAILLLCAGCDEPAAVPPPLPLPPISLERPTPSPAVDGVAAPETYEQLDILYDLQERILELEIEIAEHNESYIQTRFEDFLTLDPWALGPDQVFFLEHFCDNGDFTLPREAEVMVLERELARLRGDSVAAPTDGAGGFRASIQDRLDEAIARNEQRVADLERIVELYRQTNGDQITYPEAVSPEALEEHRRLVAAKMAEIRGQLGELDEYVADLRRTILELRGEP